MINNVVIEILKTGTSDLRRIYGLYKDGELKDGNTAKFRHAIENLKIQDLDDCGTVNDDVAVLEGFEQWYTERKGDVYYSFSIRQLTEQDAIVYMFRLDTKHDDRRSSYTWVKLPKKEEDPKYCTLEAVLGISSDDMKKVMDDFFFKDIRELYEKHGQKAPEWMHI